MRRALKWPESTKGEGTYTHNNPEIDPVLQAGGEHDRNLHGVEDGPAEIGDEFEELVFFWAGTHAHGRLA